MASKKRTELDKYQILDKKLDNSHPIPMELHQKMYLQLKNLVSNALKGKEYQTLSGRLLEVIQATQLLL